MNTVRSVKLMGILLDFALSYRNILLHQILYIVHFVGPPLIVQTDAELWMHLRTGWIALHSGSMKGLKGLEQDEEEVEVDTEVDELAEGDRFNAITVMKWDISQETVLSLGNLGAHIVEPTLTQLKIVQNG